LMSRAATVNELLDMPSAVDEDASAKAARKAAKKAAKKAMREAAAAEEEEAAAPEVEPEAETTAKKKKKRKHAEHAAEPAAEASAGEGDEDEAAAKAARKAAKKAAKQAKLAGAEAAGAAEPGEEAVKKSKKGGDSDGEQKYREKLGISVSGGGEGNPIPACLRLLADAPFDKAVIKAMANAGFKEPSTIQAQTWPIAVNGCDVVAVAKTGSGKTLGFLLPAFKLVAEKKAKPNRPLVLVLAPTRELAVQIELECQKFAKIQGISSVCVYGGVPVGPQKSLLGKGPHVVIATPGRICDLMNQGACELQDCGYVVLDEADRMLDMGFEPQITQIFDKLPSVDARQTLLFSATWPKNVRKMASKFMRPDPFHIFAQGGEDAELHANKAVSQTFIQSQDDEKDAKLWKILQDFPDTARVVIFANTKRRVDYLQKGLWDEGLGTCSIHGDKQQSERDLALKQFVAGERPLMIATDVAARGLDIKGVTHVINFDMARDVESYIHRIGRTGRAGELGASITFWNPDYDKECTPALIKIARDAGQEVPDWLAKFESSKASKLWKVADAVLQ